MEQYLILSNVRKSNGCSIGTLIRSASAFNVKEIILVGYAKYGTHGAHGSHKHVPIHHVTTFPEAQSYLRLKKQCETIYGLVNNHKVEGCIELQTHTFPSCACAFVIGNERAELSEDQRAICTAGYLCIPGGSPHHALHRGLDVNVVLAIVLHTFAVQAQFPPRAFRNSSTQGKFEVNEIAGYTGPTAAHRALAAQRQEQRLKMQDATESLDLWFD